MIFEAPLLNAFSLSSSPPVEKPGNHTRKPPLKMQERPETDEKAKLWKNVDTPNTNQNEANDTNEHEPSALQSNKVD